MGYTKYMSTAKDEGFQRKIKLCMQKAAIDVIGEDDQTPGHAERVIYAKKILGGTADVQEYSIGVVTNSTIQGKIDSQTNYDSDLQFVVESMFNDFAGYDG